MARALYRAPKLLVIDEGTSHLDAVHEAAVNAAIGKMGITRIIVAHRAETISAAKDVFILENNKLHKYMLPPPKIVIYMLHRLRVGFTKRSSKESVNALY